MTISKLLLFFQLFHCGSASIFGDVAARPKLDTVSGSIWPRGIIPVAISSNFTRSERQTVMNTFTFIHRQTCMKFVIKKPRHKDWIHITNDDEAQCASAIGRIHGEQHLNVRDSCLEDQNMILHLLMHAIGFQDEHNRYDRDLYIAINFTNIEPSDLWRFQILSKDQTAAFNLSYDYLSVMHFGAYYFARDPKYPVLIPKHKTPALGPRDGFSYRDLVKINKMYNCINTTLPVE